LSSSFSVEAFQAALKTRRFGRVFHFFPDLDSSNTRMKDLAAQGEFEGSLVLAEHQSAGRGRWGRTWQGGEGKSLLFSLLLRPPLSAKQSQLGAVLGLAALRALKPFAPQARLKWPNDIWHEGRKLSGLLLEGGPGYVVAGLGLNVNQEPSDFPPELGALSLKEVHGQDIDRAQLLAAIMAEAEALYQTWLEQGFATLRQAWDENACFMGEMVQAGALQGRVLGLDEDGALLIENEKGKQRLDSGEVFSLRPA
jgi:BirA family biotin operon repressor/biotin-[acetyl-CoA-carboxylase] ligase